MRNNGLFKEQHGTSAPMIYEGRQKQFDYLVRRDRLLGTTTLLSEERREGYRKSGVSATIDIKPEEECTFCRYRETTPMDSELDPSGRLHHKNGAVTVRNAFGYGKRDYVTILPPIYEDENGTPCSVVAARF